MFIRMLFRRLGLKQNKYLMALVYGALYALFFFLLLLALSHNFTTTIVLYSFFVGVAMFVVYLIKTELFRMHK